MDDIKTAEGKKNRVLLIGGVVLLQIIMLSAAFSLGMYIERHRRPNQPDVAPVQGQEQISGQGQGWMQLPPGLTEPPQVIGRLAKIDTDGFEIITEQGPRPILIDEDTFFRDHEGNTIAPGDLQQGYILAVYGNPAPDRQGLIATEVVLLPPPLEQPPPAQP